MIIKIHDWFYEILKAEGEGSITLSEDYVKGLLEGIDSAYNVIETVSDYSWEEYATDVVWAIKCRLPIGYTVTEVYVQYHFQGSPKLQGED